MPLDDYGCSGRGKSTYTPPRDMKARPVLASATPVLPEYLIDAILAESDPVP